MQNIFQFQGFFKNTSQIFYYYTSTDGLALLTQASAPISSTAKPSSQHFKHYDWVPVCTELEPIEAETFIKSNDYKTTCSHSNRKACNLHPHSDKLLLHTITARLPNVFEMLITKLE